METIFFSKCAKDLLDSFETAILQRFQTVS